MGRYLKISLPLIFALFAAAFIYYAKSSPYGGMRVDADIESSVFGQFSDQYLLVYFGYANCPKVCPKRLGEVKELFCDKRMPDNIKFVMIDIDEEGDIKKVQEYLDSYSATFVAVRPNRGSLLGLLNEFGAFADKKLGRQDDIEHSNLLYLLKRHDGIYRLKAAFIETPSVTVVADAIREE